MTENILIASTELSVISKFNSCIMVSITYKTIDRHHQELINFLGELEPTAASIVSLKQYLLDENKNTRRTIERLLQLSSEAVLSIVRMIIGLENLEKHEETDDMTLELAKFGVFPKSFAQKMRGFGGFRNVLVHGYAFIDNKEVFANLQKRYLLKRFASYIADYLKPRLS